MWEGKVEEKVELIIGLFMVDCMYPKCARCFEDSRSSIQRINMNITVFVLWCNGKYIKHTESLLDFLEALYL